MHWSYWSLALSHRNQTCKHYLTHEKRFCILHSETIPVMVCHHHSYSLSSDIAHIEFLKWSFTIDTWITYLTYQNKNHVYRIMYMPIQIFYSIVFLGLLLVENHHWVWVCFPFVAEHGLSQWGETMHLCNISSHWLRHRQKTGHSYGCVPNRQQIITRSKGDEDSWYHVPLQSYNGTLRNASIITKLSNTTCRQVKCLQRTRYHVGCSILFLVSQAVTVTSTDNDNDNDNDNSFIHSGKTMASAQLCITNIDGLVQDCSNSS